MKRYPNLFLIGAPKSGTTSLAAELGQHPEIFSPPQKEPRYYDSTVFYDLPEDQNRVTKSQYIDLYSGASAGEKWLLDGSVFVMYSIEAVRQILEDSPKAKFIVVLRDPLTASRSMHSQRLKTFYSHLREVSDDFYACFDLLPSRRKGQGFPTGCRNHILFRYDLLYSYELYLPTLIDLLGPRLLIVRYEDYAQNPESTHRRISAFLSVASNFDFTPETRNASEIVDNNFLTRSVYWLANKLFPLRRMLGPFWNLTEPLKKRIIKKKIKPQHHDPLGDARVRDAFSSTYDFLKTLDSRSHDQ
jgi:hypothetical protein